MSRERAERLALALGVTVEVKRPKPRAQWRVFVGGEQIGGRYDGGHHEQEWAWRAAERLLAERAAKLTRALFDAGRAAARAAHEKTRAEDAVDDARRALETAQERLRGAVREDFAARAAMEAAERAATAEQRAAWAALNGNE